MSVINTMLKDLDKRKQSHELENLHVAPVQYQRATPSKLPWILLGLVSLVLVSGIVFSWDRLTTQVSSGTDIHVADKKTDDVDQLGSILAADNDDKPVSLKGEIDPIEPDIEPVVALDNKQESGVPAKPLEPKLDSEAGSFTRLANEETLSASVEIEQATTTNKHPESSTPVLPKTVKAKVPAAHSKSNGSMAVTEVRLSDEQLAQKRLTLATEAEQRGGQNDAIVYYSEALALNPKLHQARKQLAALYYGIGRLGLAIDLLRQGITQFPVEFDYVLLLARVQQASGNKELALSTLSQIPDNSLLARQKWVEQSSLAQEVNDFVLAEQGYRNLLSVEVNQARWWMGLAYSLDAQAKYSAAKDAYKQAVLHKAVPQKGLSAQALNYIENRLVQLGEIE